MATKLTKTDESWCLWSLLKKVNAQGKTKKRGFNFFYKSQFKPVVWTTLISWSFWLVKSSNSGVLNMGHWFSGSAIYPALSLWIISSISRAGCKPCLWDRGKGGGGAAAWYGPMERRRDRKEEEGKKKKKKKENKRTGWKKISFEKVRFHKRNLVRYKNISNCSWSLLHDIKPRGPVSWSLRTGQLSLWIEHVGWALSLNNLL